MAEEIITETNRETATDHAYGGAQIQVLEGLEAVRKRHRRGTGRILHPY